MTELSEILEEIGLSQYLEPFIEHGFDTFASVADATEPDFDAIGVKLGHRRKIQRRIADFRGIAINQPLVSPSTANPGDERYSDDNRSFSSKPDAKDNAPTGPTGKRKYRRHPKNDENAPERPPSAYVIFSNKMREDLKGRHLSFTEIAKLVGENWQSLSPGEKEPFETQAFTAKEKYNGEMAEYKKTENFKLYNAYLAEFKEKYPGQPQTSDVSKRPKLINENSGGSSGVESIGSQPSSEKIGHGRGGSVGSVGQSWYSGETLQYSSSVSDSHTIVPGRGIDSPLALASHSRPGYRDAYAAPNPVSQPLSWRENSRESDTSQPPQLPRIADMGDRRSGLLGTGPTSLLSNNSALTASSNPTFVSPPPLLTSESTGETTSSSMSNNSSHFFPRTPLDPYIDRSLPIPSQMYPVKPAHHAFETQLPPLRTSSLSPGDRSNFRPPTTIPSVSEMRGYMPTSQPPVARPPLNAPRTDDEPPLDPVSALLRADEIVSRQNYPRPPK